MMPLASFLRRMDSTTTAFVMSLFGFFDSDVGAVDETSTVVDERRARDGAATTDDVDVDGWTARWRARRARRARMVVRRRVTNALGGTRARERDRATTDDAREGRVRVTSSNDCVARVCYYFSMIFSYFLASMRLHGELERFHVAVVIDGFARPSDA